jgi:hypothetical protein
MKTIKLKAPLIGAIAGTRAALGFGAGLLLGARMRDTKRRRLGWTMVGVGAATTVPLMMAMWRRA